MWSAVCGCRVQSVKCRLWSVECRAWSVIVCHTMPCLPRGSLCCDSQQTRNATRLNWCACHAKWRWRSPKWWSCHEKCNSSAENLAHVLHAPHNDFETSAETWECQEVPRLPRKTTLPPALTPSKRRDFAGSPIDTATAEENQNRDETCWRLTTSISCETSSNFHIVASESTFSCEFSNEPHILLPQNRWFVRGAFNFHPIPQNATPATEFARCHHSTQAWHWDSHKTRSATSKLVRLPRKMTTEVSKVKVMLLPRRMQLVFWKPCIGITPATQNNCRHVLKHVGMSRSATKLCDRWNIQKWPLLQNSP